MDLLQSISSLFGTNQNTAGAQGSPVTDIQGPDGLQKLLGPAALGGLAGLLFGGKGIGNVLTGALIGGGGAMLWDRYKNEFREHNAENPQYQGGAISPAAERTERMIRAMIYAARADGHIDAEEKAKINQQLQAMGVGRAQNVVDAAMIEQLDPANIAAGVMDEEEALQLFAVSCAAITIDNPMEETYINSLADALRIPPETKADIIKKMIEAQKEEAQQ